MHHKIDVLKVRPKGEGYLPESKVCKVMAACTYNPVYIQDAVQEARRKATQAYFDVCLFAFATLGLRSETGCS